MYCTNCGEKLDKVVNFCNHCGKEVKKQKPTFCTKCGGRLNPKNGICMRCLMAGRKNTEVKHKVSNDQIKLNILFNLGVIMVLVAGLVLATTNWQAISSAGKIGILVFLSIFFMIMHLLCEHKLKIKLSAYIYFILSLSFVFFTYLSLTYLDIFGHWFSLAGPGKFLVYASLALLFSLLVLIVRYKYNKRWISVFALIGFALTLFFVCKFFGLGWLSNLAVISVLLLLIYLYASNTALNYLVVILSLVVILFDGIFVLVIRPEYNIIAGTTLTVCNGLLLFIFGYLQKNKTFKILSSIVLFAFFTMFLNYSLMASEWVVSITAGIVLLLLLMTLIINAINENNNVNDVFSRTTKIASIISIVLLIIIYVGIRNAQFVMGYFFDKYTDTLQYLINLTITSFILVVCDVICIKEKTTTYKSIYSYLLPAFIVIFAFNAIRLIVNYVPSITFAVCVMILALIVMLLYLLQKKGILKTVLHIVLYVILYFALFVYIFKGRLVIESVDGIFALMLPILSLVLYFNEKKLDKHSLLFRWLSIVLFTLSFIRIVGYLDVFGFGSKLAMIIVGVTLLLIVLLFMDDLVIRRFIPFALIIPVSYLLSAYDISYIYEVMLLNIYGLVVLYLFSKTFPIKTYNILMIVGTSILLFRPTVMFNVTLSIYVSIVSILLILYDLYSKKIKGLFTVGLVYLIINTVIELQNVWSHISLWTYLLIAGIVIIILTTIKLAKGTNKKD